MVTYMVMVMKFLWWNLRHLTFIFSNSNVYKSRYILENKNWFLLPTFSCQRRKVGAQLNLPQKRKLWIQEGIHPTLKIEESATKNLVPWLTPKNMKSWAKFSLRYSIDWIPLTLKFKWSMIFGLRFSAWYWWNKKSMLHTLHFFFDFNPLLWTGSLPTSHCSTITSSLYVRSCCWMPSLTKCNSLSN